MKYSDWKRERQNSFNKLPMKAAFGEKQFKQMMSEWGLTTSKEDLKKIQSLGGGTYCLSDDFHLFIEWLEEQEKERKDFLSNETQLKDALIFEFGNHECELTMNKWAGVRAVFDDDDDEIMQNELLKKILPIAWKEFLAKCY